MNLGTSYLFASVLGCTVFVTGLAFRVDDIINEATHVTNSVNVHQIATVLEIYYLDHNSYPSVRGGPALIDTLYKDGYLKTKPLDASVFNYVSKQNGEDYDLTVTDKLVRGTTCDGATTLGKNARNLPSDCTK